MAAPNKNPTVKSANSPGTSNEELINSLTSTLEDCIIKNGTLPANEDNHSSTVGESESSRVPPNKTENASHSLEDEDTIEQRADENKDIPTLEDDLVDELALKDLELTYTDEDKERLHKEAEVFKQNGNDLFKAGQYRESALSYTQALRTCPLAYHKERSIFYANRAAAKMKLELNEAAIEDCTKALELDERYLKALYRRAQLYEITEKLDEALADYNKILEIDPLHKDALYASKRLPDQILERNEKLKTEMLGKLKDLGNLFLKPFGLSTENFQLSQDPSSGGYSVNFKS